MNKITQAYLKCALWSSTDDEGEPLDDRFSVWDIDEKSITRANEEVQDFLNLLEDEKIDWADEWTEEQFGHDFWLTKNGHGAGFWDRGYDLGGILTSWAKTFGSSYMYVGDDGKIHIQ